MAKRSRISVQERSNVHRPGGDPENSNLRVTHFFGSAQEMKTHFVLPRPLFETPLTRPARPIQCRAQTADNCSKVSPFQMATSGQCTY
jgi:hypothetical protein